MKTDVWLFLFVLGVIFFNWPIISIFQENLVLSLFIIWLIFILLMFVTSIFSKREDGS